MSTKNEQLHTCLNELVECLVEAIQDANVKAIKDTHRTVSKIFQDNRFNDYWSTVSAREQQRVYFVINEATRIMVGGYKEYNRVG